MRRPLLLPVAERKGPAGPVGPTVQRTPGTRRARICCASCCPCSADVYGRVWARDGRRAMGGAIGALGEMRDRVEGRRIAVRSHVAAASSLRDRATACEVVWLAPLCIRSAL